MTKDTPSLKDISNEMTRLNVALDTAGGAKNGSIDLANAIAYYRNPDNAKSYPILGSSFENKANLFESLLKAGIKSSPAPTNAEISVAAQIAFAQFQYESKPHMAKVREYDCERTLPFGLKAPSFVSDSLTTKKCKIEITF